MPNIVNIQSAAFVFADLSRAGFGIRHVSYETKQTPFAARAPLKINGA